MLRLGYADAARQAGNALTPTWGLPGKGAMLTLDHVLVDRGCAVLACSVHAIPGSDHRAVYAAIQLPRRGNYKGGNCPDERQGRGPGGTAA